MTRFTLLATAAALAAAPALAQENDDQTDMQTDDGMTAETGTTDPTPREGADGNGVVATDDYASGITSDEITAGMLRTSEMVGGDVYAVTQEWSDSDWNDATTFDAARDDWQQVGTITDVVLNEDGTAAGLVIEHGGFLDIGDHTVLLSMKDVRRIETDAGTIDYVTNMTESAIEEMPEVEEGGWY